MQQILLDVVTNLRYELFFCIGLFAVWAVTVMIQPKARKFSNAKTAAKPKETTHPGWRMNEHSNGSENRRVQLDVSQIRSMVSKPAQLVKQLTIICRTNLNQALKLYDEAIRCGIDLSQVPMGEVEQLLVELASTSVRAGRGDGVLRFIRQVPIIGESMPATLFSSVVRACAAKRLFKEAVSVYDAIKKAGLEIDDRALWSTLVFCSVEVGDDQKCFEIFEKFKKLTVPSSKDYANMIRLAAMRNNWKQGLALLREMEKNGQEVDNVVYNTALAACVSAQQMDVAEGLLLEMEKRDGVADCITYNTLMKGYTRSGKLDKCFEIQHKMRSNGVEASQVTFGILLDACINENALDKAAKVFDELQKNGCKMNTVLYTTLIKGFARANQTEKAMEIFESMRKDKSIEPDLVTFSILIKANCDNGRMDVALELLENLVSTGAPPDEIVFNNLLNGCVKQPNVELGRKLFQDMVSAGVKPTSVTFSILLRLYAQCKLFDEAVELLDKMSSEYSIEPEPRLYTQLIQACIRERQGKRAVEVYESMSKHSRPREEAHSAIIDSCLRFNMFETATQFLHVIVDHGGSVSSKDANTMLEAVLRKKRVGSIRATVASMERLRIRIEPRLQEMVDKCDQDA